MTRNIPPDHPLPLAVRLRDESGPPLPQMVAQRREQLGRRCTKEEQFWCHNHDCDFGCQRTRG